MTQFAQSLGRVSKLAHSTRQRWGRLLKEDWVKNPFQFKWLEFFHPWLSVKPKSIKQMANEIQRERLRKLKASGKKPRKKRIHPVVKKATIVGIVAYLLKQKDIT